MPCTSVTLEKWDQESPKEAIAEAADKSAVKEDRSIIVTFWERGPGLGFRIEANQDLVSELKQSLYSAR
jgi:hypothetical protein